ncbi:MAG: peptide MFS transporter [Candidatus Cyclobacteriaceae bacterium M3_2C_046]
MIKNQNHPKGLYFLFFAELWERFSYYGMRAILTLYMTAAIIEGGLGWSIEEALGLYGTYTSLVYLTPLVGGWLADKYLGQRSAVVIGGMLMVLGHFLMAYQVLWAFYVALGLIVAGNGFFKPNIATIVGGLYEQGDPRRDGAFTIFYMGVNIGAFLAPIVTGLLAAQYGWHYGFAAAGVGMFIGQIVFMVAARKRVFGDVGKRPIKEKRETVVDKPKTGFTREERDRIIVIFVLAFFVIFFWTGFEQAGGYMNLYTEEYTDRSVFGWEIPAAIFQSLNPMFIILLAPLMSSLWTYLGRKGKDPITPKKMALGLILLGVGFLFMVGAVMQQAGDLTVKSSLFWLVMAYFLHTVGELCLSPIGLSMVTKLAPVKLVALFMGVWFLANAAANKLAGVVGAMVVDVGPLALFGGIAVTIILFGIILWTISGILKKMMHGRG